MLEDLQGEIPPSCDTIIIVTIFQASQSHDGAITKSATLYNSKVFATNNMSFHSLEASRKSSNKKNLPPINLGLGTKIIRRKGGRKLPPLFIIVGTSHHTLPSLEEL